MHVCDDDPDAAPPEHPSQLVDVRLDDRLWIACTHHAVKRGLVDARIKGGRLNRVHVRGIHHLNLDVVHTAGPSMVAELWPINLLFEGPC
jgi:hypothetical protein